MKTQDFIIMASSGLHARPAAALVRAANLFQSDIVLTHNEEAVNLKSLIALLALGVSRGARVNLTVVGPDEEQAFQAVAELLLNLPQ